MEFYDNICSRTSSLFTKAYSTSFSLGIKAFEKRFQSPIYSIYGYVRLADEIVDTFHGHDKAILLREFREETEKAIQRGISTNPIIHAFQEVVNEYNVDKEFIDAFLDSMVMDLHNSYYEEKKYDEYIYGSAEVVGLMCLRVFCEKDEELFNSLREPARALGSAFQKVNFLRDIKSDIDERGRIYLPNVDTEHGIDDHSKKLLEDTIREEFVAALEGIKKLPPGVRLGVYSAYLYYIKLFEKICSNKVNALLKKRIRVPNPVKFMLLTKSIIEVKVLKTC
ncbi:MAG: phytoene/squalene synthase family protein [Ignavibacteriales bacterium]|nr:phytoene/squalene synthase family protein [Ignavibacteriales bacterium]MCC6637450.1 phytoene/squalene synthase family protein [Ignavibacteriaceae bacterium]